MMPLRPAPDARRTKLQRRGVIVVELILTFPVLLVLLLAVIEFSLIIINVQQVSQAARMGAKIAAETPGLGGFTDPPLSNTTATSIRTAVNRQLFTAGFGMNAARGVTLRHTVNAGYIATDGLAADPIQPTMPTSAVRVTVSVNLSELTPDLLSTFGYSTSNQTVELTTTYPYEQ
ncbi:MAG: TadE family protein [Planctomycetaceae bacterium]|nr:TadE family protein [Planctomycetaceae bacterium]